MMPNNQEQMLVETEPKPKFLPELVLVLSELADYIEYSFKKYMYHIKSEILLAYKGKDSRNSTGSIWKVEYL